MHEKARELQKSNITQNFVTQFVMMYRHRTIQRKLPSYIINPHSMLICCQLVRTFIYAM